MSDYVMYDVDINVGSYSFPLSPPAVLDLFSIKPMVNGNI